MYGDTVQSNAYIKFKIAEYLDFITPKDYFRVAEPSLKDEIGLLQLINPHAIVPTNYDRFLELVFPDYKPVIGQKIITGQTMSVGEILKIHGCVSAPDSLVFTNADYDEFIKKKKYLSAKLLTYFSEHPLCFIGYGAGDPNIRAILSDIDEALPVAGDLIPNVYIVEWRKRVAADDHPAREKLIAIDESKSVRIKAIETESFKWVFKAFGTQHALNGVSPKVLRALLARSYELVRHDIPRRTAEVDFQTLEHAVQNSESFAKLLGITTVSDPSLISAQYPYTLTDVGKRLGGTSWHIADKLILQIKHDHGIDLKASDNKYHTALKYGTKQIFHKYSENMILLLKGVLDGAEYEI